MKTWFVLLSACLILVVACSCAWSFNAIPPDVQLANPETTRDVSEGWVKAMAWPSTQEIATKSLPKFKGVAPSQYRWLAAEVFKPQQLPKDLCASFISLRDYPSTGVDSIMSRWESDKYLVQASVRAAATVVVVKDKSATPVNSEVKMRAFFNSVVSDLFQPTAAKNITRYRYNIAQRFKNSAMFDRRITSEDSAEDRCSAFLYWYGDILWWTDGQTILFSLPYLFGQPQAPTGTRIFPNASNCYP